MILSLASMELRLLRRDPRVGWTLLTLAALVLLSFAVSSWDNARGNAQKNAVAAAERTRWLQQGHKDAHSAAHYSIYAFKPSAALAALDSGVEPFVGQAVWLEAHVQNDMLYRPQGDYSVLQRAGLAHPVSPRHWLGARVLAITGWLVPAVVGALLLALAVNGVAFAAAPAELATAVGLVIAYLLFWIALGFAVLANWPNAPTAMSLLTACWLVLTLGAPVLADAAITVVAPEPSRAAFVDRRRTITTAMTEDRERILAQMFAARADLAGATAQIPQLDGVARNTFFTPAIERELEPMQAELEHARTLRERASSVAGYLIPPLGFADALNVLAGTDAQRHRHFEAQVRAHQLQLREFFYPLIQRQIVAPTPRAIAGSMGRFNFTQFDALPTMTFADEDAGERLRHVVPLLAWMLVLGSGCVAAGWVRLQRWPADL